VNSFNGSTGAVTGVSSYNSTTGAVTGVSSYNSTTGAVTGVSTYNGATGPVTGVATFNGATGAVVGVSSVNGGTGAVTGLAALASANTFTIAPQQITIDTATNKGLIVKGAASQTGSLQEWQNSSGTAVTAITADGSYYTNASKFYAPGDYSARINFGSSGAGNIVLAIRGAAFQTANLQEWQDSAGVVLAKLTAAGTLVGTSSYIAKTATYTFASGDEGNIFSMNNAATQQFNIPTDATFNFAVGTEINVFWITGAGQPTIGASTPGTTTVISTGATSATPKLRVANSGATCKKLAANSWIVFGDLA
jgi:hypothetical protein